MIDFKSRRDEATVRNYFGGFHYVFVCELILMSLITSPLARCLHRLMSGFVNGQLKKKKKISPQSRLLGNVSNKVLGSSASGKKSTRVAQREVNI